ncbi:MAG: undecaprenyl-diphosphate phosphatase [Hydrogenophilus thermoluteolus]|jgi:undecaprenyl-diphosphatase|uniref:undecaprenyl-diphosphate phosphatase n=1 Tax=Hydrogenophilus thermoluteolus TaxID=297 RepID=UPI001C6447DB|nr:undecaprenyl-diphosphate phosphatase [Hydrogenophilus thermoluteolus]MBW7655995.1 undecaprenyl-diphosphate phosphatase [Hydrogenophilus thermoluteolus]HNQ48304.1 undecaprenyl-diphosphate phosphatase [Hydrogenophilus thermoluteolus]HNU19052.1 undecaprenyl-diphosphate phosphatase [Hydrogenophilus thermoluteolus]
MENTAIVLLLGLLEGATEFLPISSTGHLIVAQAWLARTSEADKTFAIAIQLGAILAVCWHYRGKIAAVLTGLLRRDAPAVRLVVNLFVAFLPAAVVGLLAGKAIKAHLFSPAVVATTLALGGVAILLVERLRPTPRIACVEEMTWIDALKVGCAQCLALIPGTSRSGATILGGLLFGLSRTAATEFSFFLAIPTMFAATLYTLAKDWHALTVTNLHEIAVGFVAAFVAGLVAVRWLLAYISRHSFALFAWYRIALAAVVWWVLVR